LVIYIKRFRSVAEETPYFPSIKKEKQNQILFKRWGASPKRKTCISYNVRDFAKLLHGKI